MAIATVTAVSPNIEKTFKNGKSFKGSELKMVTDKGAKKVEFIFSNAPYISVVNGLDIGDQIDVKYVQNGEYWNLTDVKLIAKGSGEAPKPTYNGSSSASKQGGFQESPEKQASIQRQNALTNAIHTIEVLFANESYKKKTSPDVILDEVLRFATAFAAFNAGKDLVAPSVIIPTVEDIPGDSPFDM